ncbi:MAG TPA: VWA domain-containing protein [Gemmatimonadales bacterium]|nr:VWA domain-containing protein [Gemmatimonadales bacterium]
MRAARPDGSVLVANAVLFGRALRRAGIPADPDQTRMFLQALRAVGAGHRGDAKAAGRAVYVRCHEHRRIYDAAFDLFWRRATVVGRPSVGLPRLQQRRARPADVAFPGDHATAADVAGVVHAPQRVVASAAEHLRTADFGELTAKEARDAARMIESLRPRLPWRVSRRRRPGGSGDRPALRHVMRRSVATGGEALRWFWLRRARRPRPVALICDISGSMERYSRFLLRFAHALTRAGAPVEVFVFGTRLTRITRDLRARDADSALRQVAQRVVDWSGGTRIGESLRVLNRRWVRRTIRSGAVVLLASDGWERGDPALLRREAAALRRACHRLIWLHPLAARAGFLPATQGLQAVLPHVDQLASCGDVASLEALARTLWQTR